MRALGWIGLVISLLVVLGVIGTIAISIYFDWEYGLALLLYGIAVTAAVGSIVGAIYEFLRTSSSKTIKCQYCGMKNPASATICNRCEKLLSRQLMSLHI